MLDVPQTTAELAERHAAECRAAPGEYQGAPPGLRPDVTWVGTADTIYRRLKGLERRGLVSSLKLPAHSRTILWWRPFWTTAASL